MNKIDHLQAAMSAAAMAYIAADRAARVARAGLEESDANKQRVADAFEEALVAWSSALE